MATVIGRKKQQGLWSNTQATTGKLKSEDLDTPWYKGDTPTASEMTARANTLYAGDEVKRDEVLGKIERRMNTPGSGVYSPYRTATNKGLIDSLSALGIDTSGGINDDFFARNSGYQQYLRLSATSGTPSAPTKKSTPQEQAAYYLYQLQKDDATTKEAETEWADMQKEITYWAGKGLSDDEILAKVNADGKYTTLKKMDTSAAMGAPTALNRAVGYSKDAQMGVIWAARNGGGSGDAFADAVSYASGEGKGYNADRTSAARRDPTSASYMPYTSGSTMDDANIYFGRNDYDQAWINANKGMLTGNDSTAAKYYKQVHTAEKTTQTAEQERSAVYAWIDAMRTQGATTQQIASALQSMYDDPGSSQAVDMTTLKKMDEARQKGDPLALTRSVDWRWEDALRYAQYGTAGSKARRELLARLNTVQNPVTNKGLPTVKSTATLPREAHDAARAEKAAQAPAAQEENHLSDPAQMVEGDAAQEVAQQAEAVNATVGQQGEVDEAEREKEQAQQQRAELIDEYNVMLHSAEVRGTSNPEEMDSLRSQIDALTAQIGDGYSLRSDYTLDEAKRVLEKAYAGQEDLTAEEQQVFSNFYQDYSELFGVAGAEGEGFRDFGLAMKYGATAAEALTWTDSPEATTQESVDTIMQIIDDNQSAEASGMSLDDWYEANPEAEARLMQVKDNVQARRDANAQAAEAQAQQQREATLAFNGTVLGKVATGQAMTDEEQAAYDSIMATDASKLYDTDATYKAEIDWLYDDTSVSGRLALFGLSYDQQDDIYAIEELVQQYIDNDAKLAASAGMTLGEMYEAYPFGRSREALIEQAKNDYYARLELPKEDTPEAEGLGFFRTLGLGIDSGWNSFVAGKIGFYQAATDADDSALIVGNYDAYVRQYGIAGARREYTNDVAAAINDMSDDDPMKAQYAQALADAQANGTDIFMLPFNFTSDALRQAREKFEANVQANDDLVAKHGTSFEKMALYPVAKSGTDNILALTENVAVSNVTGSPVLGRIAGYFPQQFGDTYFDAKAHGLSRGQATLLATLDAGTTAALEGEMAEQYISNPVAGAFELAVEHTARKEGTPFFSRLGRMLLHGASNLALRTAEEGGQELLENWATGAYKAVAYGDAEEFTSQFELTQMATTLLMSGATAVILDGYGQLLSIPGQARVKKQVQQSQQQQTRQQVQEQQTAPVQVEQQQQEQQQTQQETQQVQAQEQEQQTQQEQQTEQAQEQQQQTAQTQTFEVTEEQAQAMAATIAEVMDSEEGMQQLVDARAAETTYQQIGLGAMATQQITTLTAQAQQATTELAAARSEQAQLRADLAKVQATLQKANKQASTPNGAKLIQRYAPRAAQLQQQLAQSRQKVETAQAAYQQATAALETERRGRYTQIQQQAQQQARAEMVAAKKAYAETGSFKVQQQVEQGQAQSQQTAGAQQTQQQAQAAQPTGLIAQQAQQQTEGAQAENGLIPTAQIIPQSGQQDQQQDGGTARRQEQPKLEGQRGSGKKPRNSPQKIAENLAHSLNIGWYYGLEGDALKPEGGTTPALGFSDTKNRSVSVSTTNASNSRSNMELIGAQIFEKMLPQQDVADITASLNLNEKANSHNDALRAFQALFSTYVVDGTSVAENNFGQDAVRQLEMSLTENGMMTAVSRAQDQTIEFNNARTMDKIAAMTVDTDKVGKPRNTTLRDRFRAFVAHNIDDTMAADRVDILAKKQGYDAEHNLTLNEAMRMRKFADRQAEALLSNYMSDPAGNYVGEALQSVLQAHGITTKEKLDELVTCMEERHSLSRDEQGKTMFGEAIPQTERQLDFAQKYANRPELVEAADAVSQWWYQFGQTWFVDTGLMTQETFNKFKAANPYYVPTYRDFGAKVNGDSMKAAVGSDLDIANPLDSMMMMIQSTVNRVARNDTMRVFDKMYTNGEGFGVFAREVAMPEANGAGGAFLDQLFSIVTEDGAPKPIKGDPIGGAVITMVDANGKQKAYQFADPMLFEAIMGVRGEANKASVLRALRNITSSMSKLSTSGNVAFAAKNAARDMQNSVNNGSWALTYADGAVKWAQTMSEVAKGESNTLKMYNALGGGGWTRFSTGDAASVKELRQKAVPGYAENIVDKVTSKAVDLATAEKVQDWVETTSRYVEFSRGKHDLTTEAGRKKAFLDAQMVTTDFARSGNNMASAALRSVIPFYNASLQGSYQVARMFTQAERSRLAPRLAKTAMNSILSGLLQVGIIQAFGSDKDKEWYAKVSEELRNDNIIIPLSGEHERNFLRLPIAQDPLVKTGYAIGINMASGAMGDDQLALDFVNVAQHVLSNLMSIDPIFTAQLDVLQNKTWYDSSLISSSTQSLSTTQQAKDDTLPIFKTLSRFFSAVGIESALTTPAGLQYQAKQRWGVLGKVIPAMASTDENGNWSLGNAVKNVVNSYLRQFTLDPTTSNDISDAYHKGIENVEGVITDVSRTGYSDRLRPGLSAEEAQQAVDEANALKNGAIKSAKARINALWDKANEIGANETLTEHEKAMQRKAIREQIAMEEEKLTEELRAYSEKWCNGKSLYTYIINGGAQAQAPMPYTKYGEVFTQDRGETYLQRAQEVYSASDKKTAYLPHPNASVTVNKESYNLADYPDVQEAYWQAYRDAYKARIDAEPGWDSLTIEQRQGVLSQANTAGNKAAKERFIREVLNK